MDKITWRHGRNACQEYYDARIGDDYLCVFANKWNPDVWMGMVNCLMIHNKTRNDRQRRRQGLPRSASVFELQSDWILSGTPEYMMKKVERCWRSGKTEISE